jgi:small-conductance mechanosensitive channel
MNGFDQALEQTLGLPAPFVWRLFWTALVIVLWMFARRISRAVLQRVVEDSSSRFQVTKVVGYVLSIVVFAALAKIWIQGVTGLATYFGLLSAGFAIALQDPIINFAGWLFILWRRPFKVGDRIQIGAHAGDVVDIRPFRTVLLEVGNWVHADQSTGRVLHIPNGWVFKNSVANYEEAFGYIWNELEVLVTFESNWRRAKEILQTTLDEKVGELGPDVQRRIDEAAHDMHIQFSKLTPVVWTNVTDSGIKLTMRYLCRARDRRVTSTAIWEATLDAFHAAIDVDFAYPTVRYFENPIEGKRDARAPLPALPQGGAKS